MSNAHQGSKLILKDQVIPVEFSSAHFDFNKDETGVMNGGLIEPLGASVFTVREYEGKFGGAIALESGTTNIVSNPYFDTGWGNSAFVTRTLIDAPFLGGTTVKALKLVYSGSGDGYASRSITIPSTPNRTFTFSFWVKQVGNNVGLFSGTFLQFNKASGYATVCNWSPSTVPTEWTKITITGTTPSDTSSNFNIILRPLNSTTGEIWYALPQIEEKPFGTSFVSGTRANGFLQYPKEVIDIEEGCISFWIYGIGDTGTNPNPVYSSGIDGGFDFLITPTLDPYVRAYGDAVVATQLRPDIDLYGKWTYVVVSWKKNTFFGVYIDGALSVYNTSPADWGTYYEKSATGFYIGSGIRTNPNILLSDLMIGRKMPTDEDVLIWHTSGRQFYNPFDRRAYAL
jgi:hypothetical protein